MRLVVWTVVLFMAIGTCLAGGLKTVAEAADRAVIGQKALAGLSERERILSQPQLFPAGQSISDWTAMAFALQGMQEDYSAYLESLAQYVTQQYATEERLSALKATEWHRIALTVLALGGDPRAFGVDPEGTAIDLIADGTYSYVNQDLEAQGLNGLIFALITLDAGDYVVPEDSLYTRVSLVQAILDRQNADGGFSLAANGNSDVDITAMALQALAPYREEQAREAVQRALTYLSGEQDHDGNFANRYGKSSESATQVVIALCALGLDPDTTEQFQKAGGSVLDALLSYQQQDGSFAHGPEEPGDFTATEQALLALTAAERFYAGEPALFQLSASRPGGEAGRSDRSWIIWCAVGGVAALCLLTVVIVGVRKMRGRKS